MRYVMTLTTAVVLSLATSAMALEADQVRGEIVSVDDERLTLRVEESGDAFAASRGDVNEYRITSDTRVVMEEDPMRSVVGTHPVTVTDLRPGAEVVLNFEDVDGELYARGVSMADREAAAAEQDPFGTDETARETDIAAMEGDDEREFGAAARTELPETASVLPLLALGGAGFGLLALVMRLVRRRVR